jgi:meiosis arrest female protein 1
MPFSKFIPSYHHHFGKQCRVSDYGFSKLAELFEAIGDTILCLPPIGMSEYTIDDKMIRLVPQEQIKVVGEQLRKLIQTRMDSGKCVRLGDIDELFLDEHGFQLRPEMCDAEDIEDLITNKLASFIKVCVHTFCAMHSSCNLY